MNTGKKIFIAFTGPKISQVKNIFKIKNGYECWNLKKITLDKFIIHLQKVIPPVNSIISSRHYKTSKDTRDIFSISEEQFKKCSWGILIPDKLAAISVGSSYTETLFLLNLYSPNFLYPVFYATDIGIVRQSYDRNETGYYNWQNLSKIFKNKKFVDFFERLLPQSQYGAWLLPRIKKWKNEDWRLFVAALLFRGLVQYDNSKETFTWQRESTDMATILESLFTAEDSQSEEIGYRLRKRIASLMSFKFPEIEKGIKALYNERSSFVHGSFFSQIAKDSRRNLMNMPLPNFNLLYKQKEYVRHALVAYLNLSLLLEINPAEFGNPKNTMELLERSIVDMQLRRKVISYTKELFYLLPKTKIL